MFYSDKRTMKITVEIISISCEINTEVLTSKLRTLEKLIFKRKKNPLDKHLHYRTSTYKNM